MQANGAFGYAQRTFGGRLQRSTSKAQKKGRKVLYYYATGAPSNPGEWGLLVLVPRRCFLAPSGATVLTTHLQWNGRLLCTVEKRVGTGTKSSLSTKNLLIQTSLTQNRVYFTVWNACKFYFHKLFHRICRNEKLFIDLGKKCCGQKCKMQYKFCEVNGF